MLSIESVRLVIERDRTISGPITVMIEPRWSCIRPFMNVIGAILNWIGRIMSRIGPIKDWIGSIKDRIGPIRNPIGPDTTWVRREVTRTRCHMTMASLKVTLADPIVVMLPPRSTCPGERTVPRRGTLAMASCGLNGVCRVRVVFPASSTAKIGELRLEQDVGPSSVAKMEAANVPLVLVLVTGPPGAHRVVPVALWSGGRRLGPRDT